MHEEIQKAKLTEEKEGGHSKGRDQWCKSYSLAIVVLNRRTKRTCQSKGQSGRCEVADKGTRM